MNIAAIYHRPESEDAYLYTNDLLHIRIRTAKNDISRVDLIHGDPYIMNKADWKNNSITMKQTLSTELFDYWEASVTEPFDRCAYVFHIVGNDGTEILYGDQGVFDFKKSILEMDNNYFRLPYFHESDRVKVPDWVKQTVWYQIFPERFANGDTTNDPEGVLPWGSKVPAAQDFFGGDLQGIIDHLDHLVDLGINGIYFCPIFKAHSNHKYDTIDYLEIDENFGDKKLFKQLVDKCHQLGIKVMLDAVFNHMSDKAPQWQDVVKNGQNSAYAQWFHIHQFPVSYGKTNTFEDSDEITYDTFAKNPHMPKLNTENKAVQDYLLKVGKYWITEFDIDAWRLDVANEVDHAFWKKFRTMCDETKKDFYLLGEIWHSSQNWLNGDEFSAVMNYAYTDSIKEFFAKKEISAEKMVSNINQQLMLYRQQTDQVQFNVLDSHDTARILTVANGDKNLERQILAFTYLQPGVPCIYYGDEYGMTGEDDPDCRKCMVWNESDQDRNLFDFFKRLIQMRKNQQTILSEGTVAWEQSKLKQKIIVIDRELGNQKLSGIFNASEDPITVDTNAIILSNLVKIQDKKAQIAPKGFLIERND